MTERNPNIEYVKRDQKTFWEFAKECSKEVATWPEWKQRAAASGFCKPENEELMENNTEEKLYEIALIKVDCIEDYDDDSYSSISDFIARSITEWDLVSRKDLELLCRATSWGGHLKNKMIVVERLSNNDKVLGIKEVLDEAKKKEKEKQKKEADRILANKKREATRRANALKKKEKQLEKLRKELEAEGVIKNE